MNTIEQELDETSSKLIVKLQERGFLRSPIFDEAYELINLAISNALLDYAARRLERIAPNMKKITTPTTLHLNSSFAYTSPTVKLVEDFFNDLVHVIDDTGTRRYRRDFAPGCYVTLINGPQQVTITIP